MNEYFYLQLSRDHRKQSNNQGNAYEFGIRRAFNKIFLNTYSHNAAQILCLN